jgi:hypothetical protein
MHATRRLGPAVKAEVTADLNGLPHTRITEHGDEARVFTSGLDDLTAWYLALGGRITCQPASDDSGTCIWTLHTVTDHHDGGVPVRVHALALDTDPIDADVTDAVA